MELPENDDYYMIGLAIDTQGTIQDFQRILAETSVWDTCERMLEILDASREALVTESQKILSQYLLPFLLEKGHLRMNMLTRAVLEYTLDKANSEGYNFVSEMFETRTDSFEKTVMAVFFVSGSIVEKGWVFEKPAAPSSIDQKFVDDFWDFVIIQYPKMFDASTDIVTGDCQII